MGQYQAIVELTGFVRCLDIWKDGRKTLQKRGFDPDDLVVIYLGPGASYCMCEFVLPTGAYYSCELGWNDDHSEVIVIDEWTDEDPSDDAIFARQLLTPERKQQLSHDVNEWHRNVLSKERVDRETRQREVRLFTIPSYIDWSNRKLDEPENEKFIAKLDEKFILLLPEEVDSVPHSVFDAMLGDLKKTHQSTRDESSLTDNNGE